MGEKRYQTGFASIRELHVASFTDDVRSAFLPNAKDLGFRIVADQKSEAFGDALVVLESDDIRLRIVRDRSQIFADLGSAVEPDTWFDSTIVMQALGLTTKPAFGGTDSQIVLPSIAAFLKSVWLELRAMFEPRHFAATKRQLLELQEARAAKR
jgi:hypothetical protein